MKRIALILSQCCRMSHLRERQNQNAPNFFMIWNLKNLLKGLGIQRDIIRDRNQNLIDQAKCWFCLSSPEVSKHLVISVGTEVYVALARGGLVENHFLILPITHHQSLSILPKEVTNEMTLYKDAITKYYATTDRVPVFFERNFKTSHCQLQVIPVHKNQAPDLKEAFMVNIFHLLMLHGEVEE